MRLPCLSVAVNSVITIGLLLGSSVISNLRAEGTWLSVTPPPVPMGTMLLMPDGTVMGSSANSGASNTWYRLIPSTTGGYTNGTWTTRASMHYPRLYFVSQVLPDGRMLVAGAEYGTGTTNAEIYNPDLNTWTDLPMPAGLINTNNTISDPNTENDAGFMDAGSVVLPAGKVLITPVVPATYGGTVIFDPVTSTFSAGPTLVNGFDEDEASFVKLPDDSILTIDFQSTTSERYIPSLNQWIPDSNVPISLYDPYGLELGAGFMLPNGKAFFLGSTPTTALYTPTGNTNAGSWAAGPAIPAGLGAPDAPAAMMANGKILCVFSATPYQSGTNKFVFNKPTYFYEYDYNSGPNGSFTQVHAPNGSLTNNQVTYRCRMLDLPDGTVLVSDGVSLYIYKPDGASLAAGKPAIQNMDWNANGSIKLTGTLFNGISMGASYGDDCQMDSNYPLIRFNDGAGHILYGLTRNWSSTGVMTGNKAVTTDAYIPASIFNSPLHWTMQIVANGIASDPAIFNPLHIEFSPLTNNQTVFNFAQIGGTVNENATIKFRIQQYATGTNFDLYWDGGAWTTDGNSSAVYLAATVSNGAWTPAPGVNLPARQDTRYGPYFLRVVGTDVASNSATNEILVFRSQTDTTPPLVTLDSIHNGDVFTNVVLPGVSGNALDYESDIASVTVFLYRFTDSGILYWNGSTWTTSGVGLTAAYNAQTVTWQLNNIPSGANLPNGNYQIQISVNNSEAPPQVATLTVSFAVDYHPVFIFTAGTFFDSNPNNDNYHWFDPGNWDKGQVPPPESRVIINGYAPDNIGDGTSNLYELDLLSGNISAPAVNVKKLIVSGANLTADVVNIASNGLFTWTLGTLTVSTCNVPPTATLMMDSFYSKNLGANAVMNLGGTTLWTNTGYFAGANGCVINNSGTFIMQSDSGLYNYTGGTVVFNNDGSVIKTNSSGTTIIMADNGGWEFNQNGTIDVESGVFRSDSALNVNPGSILSGPGIMRIASGTTTFSGNNIIEPGSTLQFSAGILAGTNVLSGGGAFDWTSGYFTGAMEVQSNITTTLSSAGQKNMFPDASLTLRGPTTWSGAGNVYMSHGAVITNAGAFSAQNDAFFYNDTDGDLPAFVNYGTFTKANGTNTTTFRVDNGGIAFDNFGQVNVSSGTLSLAGGGESQSSTFTVAPGAELDFAGGEHQVGPSVTFDSGATKLTGGTLTLVGSNALSNAASFEIVSGYLHGTNALGGAGSVQWSGGSIFDSLAVQTPVGLNITGAGQKILMPSAVIDLGGNGGWSGNGQVVFGQGAAITNRGTFLVTGDGEFYNNTAGLTPVFVNLGSFIKTNSTNVTFLRGDNDGVAFNNGGLLSVQSGSLRLAGGGAFANDAVRVAAGVNVDFTGGSFFWTGAHSLAGPGTNRIAGATVDATCALTFATNATLSLESGILGGTNTLTGSGNFYWSGGTIAGRVTELHTAGIPVFIAGPNAKTFSAGGVLSFTHNCFWMGGDINMAAGSAMINDTGFFNISSGARFYNFSDGNPQPVFQNNGNLVKQGTPNTSIFDYPNGGVAFNNNGFILVESGELVFAGGGASLNGNYNAVNAFITFNSGNYTNSGTTTIQGAGTRVTGATVTINGMLQLPGTLQVASGFAGGTNTVSGAGSLNVTSGSLFGQWSIQPGGTMNFALGGDKTLMPGTSLNNQGTINWTGGGNINMGNGSVINNAGLFSAQCDYQFFNYTGGSAVVTNTGIFRKTASTGTTGFHPSNGGVAFVNNGTLDLRTGTLEMDSTFTAGAGQVFSIPLGGTTAGTQFGKEYVSGVAPLTGTLSVTLTNGFVPTNGQSFTLANYSSHTGQFSATQFPPLPSESTWQLVYNPNSLVLKVVPSTTFTAMGVTNGDFGFSLSGPSGSSLLIEASTNLVDWAPILTNAPFNGNVNFSDPQSHIMPKRFYKATITP